MIPNLHNIAANVVFSFWVPEYLAISFTTDHVKLESRGGQATKGHKLVSNFSVSYTVYKQEIN